MYMVTNDWISFSGELQIQLASSVEKERSLSEEVLGQACTLTTLETQLNNIRQEKTKLNVQYNIEKTKSNSLQENYDGWVLTL